MPDSSVEKSSTPAPAAREELAPQPISEPKQSVRGSDHGGIYASFREIAATSAGQEPPPEKFSNIFRKAEFTNPVNDAQKERVLGALQEQYGNRYVQRVLAPGATVRPLPDATPAMRIFRHDASGADASDSLIASSVSPQIESSGGHSLSDDTQRFMESRFGHDFDHVHVHDDAPAHEAAKNLNAEAFTTGRDIYFSQGAYNPSTPSGQGLLAHELTHVVQQDGGAANRGTYGFHVSQPSDQLERQADAASEAIMRGEMFPPITSSTAVPTISRRAGGRGSTAQQAAPSRDAASGTPAPVARPGDFPITIAGMTVTLPSSKLIDKAIPGGKLAVPRDYYKFLSVPGFKVTGASLDFDENKAPKGATIDVAVDINDLLDGTGNLIVDKNGNASGSAHINFHSRKIPGIKDTTVDTTINKDDFNLNANLEFDLPHVTGTLSYKYENKLHSGKGTAKYEGSKLKGDIEIILSEAGKLSGSGKLEMELFKGLRAEVDVAVDEKRNVKVKGKVSVPGQIELFPEKKIEKSFFSFENKFPLWGITIPVIDVNVGLFAEVHAGAGFRAKFGPGVLRDIALTGEFGTDPEAATEFGLGGEFFVPAGAEIVVNAGGGIGLGLAIADITGGVEAVGVAGIYTALSVRPQFQYAGGKYSVSGVAELAGVAQAKLSINAFAKIDVGVWLFKGTVWRKDWNLAEWVWNAPLPISLRATISYTLGDEFNPDIKFETPEIDPEKLVKDVMPESGSPVPAPPKPAVPDKGSFNAEGAQGKQAEGAAKEGPTPQSAGSPSATTQKGKSGGGADPNAKTEGGESPEQAKQLQEGLTAIDAEQAKYLTNGQIQKTEAEQVAAKVKRDHPVFKSLTVVDGDKTWDYEYEASPKRRRKGPTKEAALKELPKYDAKLNSAGQIEGNFSDATFDFGGYNFQTNTSPAIHPANKEYQHPLGPDIHKPSGHYVIGSGMERDQNGPKWKAKIDIMRNGKKAHLAGVIQSGATEEQKMQLALTDMGMTAQPSYFKRPAKSSAELIDWLAEHDVRQQIEPNMPYQDIYLIDWQEHHIKPIDWSGTNDPDNMIFIRRSEHQPISNWFAERKRLLKAALK